MTTISAKELRLHLSEYLQRTMRGEEIEVIYRSRPAIRLQPLAAASRQPAKGSAAAFRATMAVIGPELHRQPSRLDPNRPINELYHELLDHDPKYNPQP